MPKRKYSNFGEPVKCEFEDCTIYFQKTTKTKMQRFCSNQCSQAWRKVSGYKQICSEETKLKMSLAKKGKKNNLEHTAKIIKFHIGRKRTEETCKRIGESKSGTKLTDEHRRKLSEAGKGRTWAVSEEGRRNMGIAQKEYFKTHNVWNKGENTPENEQQRSKFKETLRIEILERDNYTCVNCGKRKYLQVDHIKPWSKHPELRFEPNNCQTLCMACHYLKTYEREIPEGVIWGSYKQNKQKEIG